MNRGDAAAATRTFRGDESRRRRGRDADIPWRRVSRPRPRARGRFNLRRADGVAVAPDPRRVDDSARRGPHKNAEAAQRDAARYRNHDRRHRREVLPVHLVPAHRGPRRTRRWSRRGARGRPPCVGRAGLDLRFDCGVAATTSPRLVVVASIGDLQIAASRRSVSAQATTSSATPGDSGP